MSTTWLKIENPAPKCAGMDGGSLYGPSLVTCGITDVPFGAAKPAFRGGSRPTLGCVGSRRCPMARTALRGSIVSNLKGELHRELHASRAGLLSKLEDLTEYDMRRPMTPTGTNLLGLVKHLAGLEYGYLGESFKRPPPETLPWVEDGSIWEGADMWATPDESSSALISLYQRACAHADRTIEDLELDAPGLVAYWSEDRRDTTLGVLLIRMVAETARHAGHADIVRELIDGKAGTDHDQVSEPEWRYYLARVHAAADSLHPTG